MNLLVVPEIIRQGAPNKLRLHVVMNCLDLADLSFSNMQAGKPARERLEGTEYFKQVPDVFRRQLNHASTTVGQQLHQALMREHLQRFAQTSPRHFEPLTEDPFVQPLAGREFVMDDQIPQRRQDSLMQRLRTIPR